MSASGTVTLLTRLTPPGTGAIAVLGLAGPKAWTILRETFLPISPRSLPLPAVPEEGHSFLGKIGGALTDQVLLVVRKLEPFPIVEIHCHGGPAVIALLEECLAQAGVPGVPWQQWESHCGKGTLQTEILSSLTRAASTRTASILLDQFQGAFARTLDEIRLLIKQGDWKTIGTLLEPMHRLSRLAGHLVEPWRIVVLGSPNVGKSSLVNALAGYQRSIVHPTPGTTRDLVSVRLTIDGWPVELIDTAGLRAGGENLELAGMALAREAAQSADLVLCVHDALSPLTEPTTGPNLRLLNKIDLLPASPLPAPPDWICVSALTGEGLRDLCQRISLALVPEPPPPGQAVPPTAAWAKRIDDAMVTWQRHDLAACAWCLNLAPLDATGGAEKPGLVTE